MKNYDRVAAVLADCLGIEQAAIQPSDHLEDDLGVESIDLLDILYRLEEEFGIPMEREALFPDFLFMRPGKSLWSSDLATAEQAEVRKFFPFLNPRELSGLYNPRSLLTVRVLVAAVEQRLESVAPPATRPSLGSARRVFSSPYRSC